jgi:hypothetical protein
MGHFLHSFLRGAALLAAGVALPACSARYAEVPPRLDLEPMGRIALVTFSTEGDKAALGPMATQRFAEAVLQSQTNIEIIELDPGDDSTIANLAREGNRSALAAALGRDRDIPAVFLGQLVVSGTQARGRLKSPTDIQVKAEVRAELAVQLVSTRTGGTVWRSSAAARGTVGAVSFDGGLPSVAARDADEAWGDVMRQLASDITRDLRPTYVKQ